METQGVMSMVMPYSYLALVILVGQAEHYWQSLMASWVLQLVGWCIAGQNEAACISDRCG